MGLYLRFIKRSSCDCSDWMYVYDHLCCTLLYQCNKRDNGQYSLFALGALIFGPQLLIGVSLTGFVPKNAISVANGMTGSFAYLFGDSMAKVGLAAIADPTRNGLNIFGYTLSGWTDVLLYSM